MPSHNCIIIITMFSFQGTSESLRDSMKQWNAFAFLCFSQPLLDVVEISGIEPLTSCLQGRRSPSWAKPPYIRSLITNWKPSEASFNWRGEADLRLSIELSVQCDPRKASFDEVVGQNGLEPSTSRLSVVCSSQLSYWPILDLFTSSLGTLSPVPSKLNNVKLQTLCTDLRTLQEENSFSLKSP